MGIQSFLIFGDNCRFFFKDMGYFLKKLMGYGILGPPLPGPHGHVSPSLSDVLVAFLYFDIYH